MTETFWAIVTTYTKTSTNEKLWKWSEAFFYLKLFLGQRNHLHPKVSWLYSLWLLWNAQLGQPSAKQLMWTSCRNINVRKQFVFGGLQQELLDSFWSVVLAYLSSPFSVVALLLSSLHSSSLPHSFLVSGCACRRGCNDKFMAAVCLCVWHCDVSLLAITPSLSFNWSPNPTASVCFPSLCLCLSVSIPLFFSWSQCSSTDSPPLTSALALGEWEHRDPRQQQTGTELHDLPIDFH